MDNAPTDLIDDTEKLQAALSYWKNTTFSQHYLKLDDVVSSFETPQMRLVNARQEFTPRWVLCRPGAKKPATFWTVGVWRWSSHLEMGNYVPPGEIAPARLAEGRIQRAPNSLCQFSYALDTTHDTSLWKAQAKFEEYIVKVNGFNPHQKERREWQNGAGPQHSFVLSSQMFVKRTTYTRAKEASRSYELHPWIAAATKKGMEYFANNERPEIFEPDTGGGLRPLSECHPPTLRLGDLVWVSFSVEFFIGGKFWSTNFVPYEFVRVGTVALDLLPDIRKEFDIDDVEAPRERLGAGMRGIAVDCARQLDAGDARLPGPSGERYGSPLELPAIPAEAMVDEPGCLLDDPERQRQVQDKTDLHRHRTPQVLLNSEVDGGTKLPTDDESKEGSESELGHFADAVEHGDHDSTTADSMFMDDEASVADNDGSVADDDGFVLDDDGSIADDDGFVVDDDGSLTDDDSSLTDDDGSLTDDDGSIADDDGFMVDEDASMVENEAFVVVRRRPAPSPDNTIKTSEAAKESTAGRNGGSKPRGRKRAASSERPQVEGVGIRVLPDRRAKGKGIAR